MKLYTEEQVLKAFIAGMEFIPVDPNKYEQDANEYMESLTSIELPSDEEIRFKSHDFIVHFRKETFFDGAKWMKEQILNQNK